MASAKRVRVIRTGAVRGMIGPAAAVPYVLVTWRDAPHRPAMLLTLALMLLIGGLTLAAARRLAGSRARVPVQVAASLANLAGAAVAGVLDGGATSPLGAWMLFSLLFIAIMTPPRTFVALAALGVAGYLWLAWSGGHARPGYVAVHLVGTVAVTALCFRHAAALVSLRRRLSEVSTLDPLTGALNRRGFEQRLDRALAHATDRGTPVTLVLVDLDRFKEVNDTFGHRAGDGLLTWAAHALGRDAGSRDTVGRLGGDEFAVLLTGTPATAAEAATERLRSAVTTTAPASFGHATYPDDAASADELRHLADVRLYADKVSRERALPSPDAVERAATEAVAHRPPRISRRERRRRSVAAAGWLAVVDNVIGLLYVALFTSGSPHRLEIAVIVGVGLVVGGFTVVQADRLSHFRRLSWFLQVTTLVHLIVAWSATWYDGGLTSPIAFGLLLPMPLVALTAPPRSAVPVVVVLGALYVSVGVATGTADPWFVTMRLTGAVTAAAACAMQGREAALRRVQLMRLSRIDVLTECLNRRGFEERFETELAQAADDADGLSLLILDLDGFKTLNDTKGHAAGDGLLRWVGATLRDELRSADAVGRLGGDEFVALLPRSTPDAARATADRLVAALSARTRVSVGVASMPGHGADFQALYHHADQELYAEKSRRGSRRGTPAAVPAQSTGRADVRSAVCP